MAGCRHVEFGVGAERPVAHRFDQLAPGQLQAVVDEHRFVALEQVTAAVAGGVGEQVDVVGAELAGGPRLGGGGHRRDGVDRDAGSRVRYPARRSWCGRGGPMALWIRRHARSLRRSQRSARRAISASRRCRNRIMVTSSSSSSPSVSVSRSTSAAASTGFAERVDGATHAPHSSRTPVPLTTPDLGNHLPLSVPQRPYAASHHRRQAVTWKHQPDPVRVDAEMRKGDEVDVGREGGDDPHCARRRRLRHC